MEPGLNLCRNVHRTTGASRDLDEKESALLVGGRRNAIIWKLLAGLQLLDLEPPGKLPKHLERSRSCSQERWDPGEPAVRVPTCSSASAPLALLGALITPAVTPNNKGCAGCLATITSSAPPYMALCYAAGVCPRARASLRCVRTSERAIGGGKFPLCAKCVKYLARLPGRAGGEGRR